MPRVLPPKAHLIVSVISSDVQKLTELTDERGYTAIDIVPLKEKEREEIALVRKKYVNKTLSTCCLLLIKTRMHCGDGLPLSVLHPLVTNIKVVLRYNYIAKYKEILFKCVY